MNPYPCSLANEMSPEDDRQKAWADQRKSRGFDSTELWNLDRTIAIFLLPRLKAFHEVISGSMDKVFTAELQAMIDAFTLLADDQQRYKLSPEQSTTVHKGLQLLAKNYFALWL